jgi:hypothetical protein
MAEKTALGAALKGTWTAAGLALGREAKARRAKRDAILECDVDQLGISIEGLEQWLLE